LVPCIAPKRSVIGRDPQLIVFLAALLSNHLCRKYHLGWCLIVTDSRSREPRHDFAVSSSKLTLSAHGEQSEYLRGTFTDGKLSTTDMASKVELYASEKSSATSHICHVLDIDVLREDYQLREREEQCLAEFYDAFGRHLGADDCDCAHDGATPLLRWLKEIAQHSDDPNHVVRLYVLAAERVPRVRWSLYSRSLCQSSNEERCRRAFLDAFLRHVAPSPFAGLRLLLEQGDTTRLMLAMAADALLRDRSVASSRFLRPKICGSAVHVHFFDHANKTVVVIRLPTLRWRAQVEMKRVLKHTGLADQRGAQSTHVRLG